MKDPSLLVGIVETASSTGQMAERRDPVAGGRYGKHRSKKPKSAPAAASCAAHFHDALWRITPFPPGLFIFRRCENPGGDIV